MNDTKTTLESALESFELGGRNVTEEHRKLIKQTNVLAPLVNVSDLERIVRLIRLRYGSTYNNVLYNLFQTLVNSTKGEEPLFQPTDNSLVAVELGQTPKVGGGTQRAYTMVFFEDVRTVPFSRYPYDGGRTMGVIEPRGGELVYSFDSTHSVNIRHIESPENDYLFE